MATKVPHFLFSRADLCSLDLPKGPSLLKYATDRVNFGTGSKFGTEVAKRYGEGSKIFFLGKRKTLKTHTTQIWGVKIHPPNLGGES